MLEMTFDLEKETKNTKRYAENVDEGPPKINTLYIQKWAVRQLGDPKRVKVTIEAC